MELKPCPFCGEKEIEVPDRVRNVGDFWVISCPNCGAEGPGSATLTKAMEIWNHRVVCEPAFAGEHLLGRLSNKSCPLTGGQRPWQAGG